MTFIETFATVRLDSSSNIIYGARRYILALLTFEEAIAESEHFSKRHLLLGNGFSIAYCCWASLPRLDFRGLGDISPTSR